MNQIVTTLVSLFFALPVFAASSEHIRNVPVQQAIVDQSLMTLPCEYQQYLFKAMIVAEKYAGSSVEEILVNSPLPTSEQGWTDADRAWVLKWLKEISKWEQKTAYVDEVNSYVCVSNTTDTPSLTRTKE